MRRSTILALPMAAALALGLVGCGSGGTKTPNEAMNGYQNATHNNAPSDMTRVTPTPSTAPSTIPSSTPEKDPLEEMGEEIKEGIEEMGEKAEDGARAIKNKLK